MNKNTVLLLEQFAQAAEKFCRKVEVGRARSTETYEELKKLLYEYEELKKQEKESEYWALVSSKGGVFYIANSEQECYDYMKEVPVKNSEIKKILFIKLPPVYDIPNAYFTHPPKA